MTQSYNRTRRVEFRDTDAAGIVHFSVFFTYMEETEHEFLRELGLGVKCEIDGRWVSFPRVSARCDYRIPLKFEQLVDIELSVGRIGTKSVTYDFRFVLDGRLAAEGSLTAVCCEWDEAGGPPVSIAIPQTFCQRLGPFQSPTPSS